MHAKRTFQLVIAAPALIALSGCLSLSVEPPESLLNLTSSASAPAGTGSAVSGSQAIAVYTPEVPARLDVTRVPVTVSETEIAYLQDAFWVEKPARLFRRLVGETLRTRTGALVLDTDDAPVNAPIALRGTLREFGYDATRSAVVVRFDAIRSVDGGAEDSAFETRRFEAVESGILPEAGSVGPALNRAANQVAGEVTEWFAEMPATGVATAAN
ncbi:MAG: ABC-type transport auxiliary lipoprotein family protein [Pseudomonadota bacterium]